MVENSELAGAVLASIFGGTLIAIIVWKHFRYPRRKGFKADPLAEAEVYVAYGQKERAIRILEKARLANPERQELTKKLAELRNE